MTWPLLILAVAAGLMLGWLAARATVDGVPAHWSCRAWPHEQNVTCTRRELGLLP